jgi:exonuclease SbcC
MQQLSKLCEEANRRFYKLTHNALMLEVDAEGDILVRDMQHDEELRSIRTLSGGQTFLASLCLALALSERVQKAIGIEQPFMFIDEGFGTLDTDSRIEVMEALLSLKKEKRTVGVISHSDEIKDLMPAYLHVVNTEERGSEIEVVLS